MTGIKGLSHLRSVAELRGVKNPDKWPRTMFRVVQVTVKPLPTALRYGDGRPVDVRIEWDDDTVRVTVRDLGYGCAEVDRARIFEPFERRENALASGAPGVVHLRQLARARDGAPAVGSRVGEGSAFTLSFPERSCEHYQPFR